jgi:uncharacterized membrane protein YeaQ/YmgE (transglycosylase-associated protein family)
MHIISWIVFGLVAGAIAKLLTPGRDPGGCIITMLLGIAGAMVGGVIARMVGFTNQTQSLADRGFLSQLAFAVVGAVVILAVYHLIAGRRA